MELVDYKEKIAKALLREKTQRYFKQLLICIIYLIVDYDKKNYIIYCTWLINYLFLFVMLLFIRFYHADNCLWVSTRSLMQYRKLATRAYNQRCKSLPRNRKVFFTFSSQVRYIFLDVNFFKFSRHGIRRRLFLSEKILIYFIKQYFIIRSAVRMQMKLKFYLAMGLKKIGIIVILLHQPVVLLKTVLIAKVRLIEEML